MSAEASPIGTERAPGCPLCGDPGAVRHRALTDRVFGAAGEWTMKRCGARGCGLFWLDPRPAPAEIHKAYRTYYTHGAAPPGDEPRSRSRQIYDRIRAAYLARHFGYAGAAEEAGAPGWMASLAPLHPGGSDAVAVDGMFLPARESGARLLEVGCGNGYLLRRMRALGWEVEGVEFDPACVAGVESLGMRCRTGDLREQHYPDGTFDALFTGNVIEHVYDPAGFVRECFRVLAPGATIVFLTPNTASFGHAFYGADWRGLEPPRHLQIFNLKSLGGALTQAGFTLAEARTTNRGAWYIWGMSAAIRAARRRGAASITEAVRPFSLPSLARQAIGRSLRRLFPTRGEELLVIARKP